MYLTLLKQLLENNKKNYEKKDLNTWLNIPNYRIY